MNIKRSSVSQKKGKTQAESDYHYTDGKGINEAWHGVKTIDAFGAVQYSTGDHLEDGYTQKGCRVEQAWHHTHIFIWRYFHDKTPENTDKTTRYNTHAK